MRKNTNKALKNLTDIELKDDKITVLKSSLQHGLFIRPEKYETFAIVEDIYD